MNITRMKKYKTSLLLALALVLSLALTASAAGLSKKVSVASIKKPVVLKAGPAALAAPEFYLRAEAFQATIPGEALPVTMWGFAQDSAWGVDDGVLSSPGPLLNVPSAEKEIVIHVKNRLSVPISIVIPGLTEIGAGAMVPVYSGGRVSSFTHETPANNAVDVTYTFTFQLGANPANVKSGTFLYHSGTHPSVQVQMGLFGGITRDAGADMAYTGTAAYDNQVVLIYSEVDPVLHKAVADGVYGVPGAGPTSTFDYAPKYFLVNGKPFSTTDPLLDPYLPAGAVGDNTLVRFLNAGLMTHVPLLLGSHLSVIAEDGNKYADSKEQYEVHLPALKTMDAFFNPSTAGDYPIYDRRLFLANGTSSPGGMLRYLRVVQ